jgi:two-component system phosphate regulon response regulator OmpR
MARKPHIVVVDDERDVRETVGEYLELHGYAVSVADGGTALRRLIAGEKPVDLVILDLNMPGEDGLTLARFLREHAKIGIIMLTAAGTVVDRVVGLEVGADDYLPKPADLRELLARVKTVLRRVAAAPAAGPRAKADEVRFGRFVLNLAAHKLTADDGSDVPLTSMEFDLLKAFATHPNKVLNRDRLLELAHNRDWDPFDRSIDVRITRIRRKVEADPAKPQLIKTVRGAGYMFVPEGEG